MKPRKISLVELVRRDSNCELFKMLGYLEFKKKYDMLNGFVCERCGQFDNCLHYTPKSKKPLTHNIKIGKK